jgi:hypothetical protein
MAGHTQTMLAVCFQLGYRRTRDFCLRRSLRGRNVNAGIPEAPSFDVISSEVFSQKRHDWIS